MIDTVRGVLVNILKLCRDASKINSKGNYWNPTVEFDGKEVFRHVLDSTKSGTEVGDS
jgi:hypothetical protein